MHLSKWPQSNVLNLNLEGNGLSPGDVLSYKDVFQP